MVEKNQSAFLHTGSTLSPFFLSAMWMWLPGGSGGKESACNAGDLGLILGLGRSTPVFLPGESPWTEEPGGLQSVGLQTVGHD